MTKLVAASNAPSEWKTVADYVCDGVADQSEIQSAFGGGEGIVLSPGTFNISGDIEATYGDMTGQGADQTQLTFTNNAHLYANSTAVQTIQGFSFYGSGYSGGAIYHGVLTVRGPNKTLKNLNGSADGSIQAVFLFLADPAINNSIQNILVENCHVDGANTYAFLHSQWFYQTPPYTPVDAKSTHKDITYLNCSATNCGSATAYNQWVTGFDFAEMNHIENLIVRNCRAEKNWESGFHFEFAPIKTNCLLEDCVSLNNGQKPYKESNFSGGNPWPSHGTDYFGTGFNCFNQFDCSVTFRRCYAEGNSWFGFCVNKGVVLEDCVDYHTGKTLLRNETTRTISPTLKNLYKPSGYRVYPSRYGSVTYTLQMEDCSSFECEGFAIHCDSADRILINGLTIVDPVGVSGIGCCFGCVANQFSNASVSGLAIYCNLSTPLWCQANDTATYDGSYIVTTGTAPFYFAGPTTNDCQVKNFIVYSDATLEGETGVTRDGTFGSGELIVSGMSQQTYANAPTKPTAYMPGSGPILYGEQFLEEIILTWEDPE